MSASENYVPCASAGTEGGRVSKSEDMGVASSLGLPFSATILNSLSFRFQYGVLAEPEAFDPGSGPIVLGASAATGAKGGGDVVTVFGLNFGESGALPKVYFGSARAPESKIRTNSAITVATPPGVNLYGNPLGPVPVTVSTDAGSYTAANIYTYLPALVLAGVPHRGGRFEIRFLGAPGSTVHLATGVKGSGVRWGPFDGAWELRPGWRWLGRDVFAPNGVARFVLEVPSDAGSLGGLLEFQAICLTAGSGFESTGGGTLPSSAGSFTNRLTVKIEP